jgi:hypothetical protein
VFPVRYELNFCVLLRKNSVFKGLKGNFSLLGYFFAPKNRMKTNVCQH